MLNDFSSHVLQNVPCFLIGEPKHVRLNADEALKIVQQKYKTNYSDIESDVDYYSGIIEECLCHKTTPKMDNLNLNLSSILKQSEKIRNMLKQSSLLYKQPDMTTEILI